MLSEGMERAAEEQKSQCLQGFPCFCRLAGRERDTPGLPLRVFCPLGPERKRRQTYRRFGAKREAGRENRVAMVYINLENRESKDLNCNFQKTKMRKMMKI